MRIAALVLIAALGSTARVSLAPASTLEEVLERAGAYIGRFDAAVASVVAEEHYLQKYVIPDALPAGRVTRPYEEKRDIKSDFLMVRSQESDLWIPFRDVYEVDGKPVREREERLTRLLGDASGSAYDRARRLTEEGARYNIGPVRRTVNIPTQALQFLRASNQPRSVFRKTGEGRVDGITAWQIQFEEIGLPTLIRTTGGASLPAAGSFWIDPVSGIVLRSLIRTRLDDLRAEIEVGFAPSDVVDVRLPAELKERYRGRNYQVDGVATYTRFRRFRITTNEAVK
jgi:hypothetical protein